MRRPTAKLVAFAVLVGTLAAAGTAAASGLSGARSATAGFHKLARGQAADYTAKVVDVNGISCIAEAGEGTMGVHWLNPGLLDDSISATSPELLVYEPRAHGKPRLVALEYLMIKSVWDASHSSPPRLFGHEFMVTEGGNRFGLPAFYSLHAWIWKHNPSGTFAMWNPNVHCP
ncbi:MAG TPA: hypothetical protein VFW80_08405 [Gaiellaceae bacterium]|nr:hypothetical protein [Gaiellaceae bacterium]